MQGDSEINALWQSLIVIKKKENYFLIFADNYALLV